MSLYKKYIFATAATMLLVPGFFSWVLFKINSEQIYSADRQRVELVTHIINNGLRDVMLEGGGEKEFQRFLDRVVAKDVKTARIFSENGTVLSSTVIDEIGKSADEKYMKMYRSLQGASFRYEHDGSEASSGISVINNDLSCQKCHGGSEKIRGILGVEVSGDTVDESLGNLKNLVVRFYLIGAIFSFVPVFLTGRYLVKRPADVLLNSLRDIEKGALTPEMSLLRKDEIGEISAGISRLAEELGRCRNDRQEEFRGDRDAQREKMASIGEAAAIFAHEIKNPLAGISGALQVMAEDIPDGSPRRQICREMLDEIERLDTAVKDLLAYAKTPEPHLILTDINDMIERACAVDRPTAGSSGVEIKTAFGAVPEAMIDQEQMGKVFVNMIRNAINRMTGGGILTVTTVYLKDKGEIEIAFSDTGREMPGEKIMDVFKPFFSTKQLGAGLKLAISRNIVESHKGRMKAVNKPGGGCLFSIIIPAKG